MIALLLLSACETGLTIGDGTGPDGEDEGSHGGNGVEEVGENPDSGSTEEDPEEPEFFDDTFIHEVAITLATDAISGLRRDPYEFVDGDIVVDGAELPHVGVRLRGKIGSFRDLSGKPKFKIDFNHYVEGQKLGDHKALALNNEVVDCSYLREFTGYAVFRQLGLPTPRTAYTHVTVNGADYGLYVGVEYPDDSFLADRYADGSGNLYDGKYLYYDTGSYQLLDFTPDLVHDFVLEEGTDVGGADVAGVTAAIRGDAPFADRLGAVLDLDAFHRYIAAEQWVGHLDGYALNTNNYRVYFDPEDGRADFLVYDLDYAFYPASDWGMNWSTPRGVLVAACWQDEACLADHAAAVADVIATVDTDTLLAQMDTWAALIHAEAVADPRRECTADGIFPSQSAVRNWAATGSTNLGALWGVP